MNSELEAVKDAMDKSTGGGRDYDKAVELSDAYIAARPELFAQFQDMSIEDCVRAVDVFRAAGMRESEWNVEVWIKHKWPPQNIGGVYKAQVRIVNNG